MKRYDRLKTFREIYPAKCNKSKEYLLPHENANNLRKIEKETWKKIPIKLSRGREYARELPWVRNFGNPACEIADTRSSGKSARERNIYIRGLEIHFLYLQHYRTDVRIVQGRADKNGTSKGPRSPLDGRKQRDEEESLEGGRNLRHALTRSRFPARVDQANREANCTRRKSRKAAVP